MVILGARRFAASVSLATLGVVLAQPAFAATTEGVRQEDSGTIAINLYEVAATDPDSVFGTTAVTNNPGGLATATAWVTCAEAATCANSGALEQFASGVDSATNDILIEGLQRVEAIAEAVGRTATAVAYIDTGIHQLAVSGGKALNDFDVTGTVEVVGSALAEATDGQAIAQAIVSQAILLEAIGGTAATIDFDNDGLISIAAVAEAISGGTEADTAYARATAFGIAATAVVTGEGTALADLYNAGTIEVVGDAHASAAEGRAVASGVAILGLGAVADAAAGQAIAAVENDGTILLSGEADATGGHAATAIAVAAGGIVAQAYAGTGDAFATIINDGDLVLSADAHAQANTNAFAYAAAVTGLYQQAQAMGGNAVAEIVNNGSIVMQANADATALVAQATAVAGGPAFAGAIFQSAAAGNGTGEAIFVNAGEVVLLADADAYGSVIAYANALGGPGVQQLAFGTGGDAIASFVNEGSILLGADAFASASNSAFALATYVNGLNNAAFANSGDAEVDLVNSGEILVGLNAVAQGSNVAGALAVATRVMGQMGFAFGGDADVVLDNDGTIAVEAGAFAEGDFASALAFVSTVLSQNAIAIGGGGAIATIDNAGAIDIAAVAGASGVTAYATAGIGGGIIQVASAHSSTFGSETLPGGTFVRTSTSTPTGVASAALINSGSIDITAAAAATGEDHAEARASVSGVFQFVSGLEAEALIDNSGSLTISAAALAEANGNVRADVSVAGIAQVGTALASATVETLQPGGTMTVELSSIPVGQVQVELTNSGDIAIVGAASAVAGEGGLGGLTEAVAYAGVAGIDQSVIAQTASALFDNDGSILIGAQAKVVSAGIANGVALASGIDQAASAYAVGGTAVFPPGATTPTTFTAFAYPAGPASVSFDNEGTITVVASVEASGQTAFGGATAQGVGQSVSGTIGTASLDNSGSLTVIGRVDNTGGNAFALAGAIGVVQGASGTEQAVISLDNSGEINIAGIALASGETGGFANVTAVGLVQNAFASGSVTVDFVNSGSIAIDALASGVGGESAAGFVFARGLIQSGQGGAVDLGFDNSGSFELNALAKAESSGVAYASATVFNAIGQAAIASGDAVANMSNDGSIVIAVQGLAEGAGNVVAGALLSGGLVQQVAALGSAAATIENSGDVTMAAVAHAAGSLASADAMIIAGLSQVAVVGSTGDAAVVIDNQGSITLGVEAEALGEDFARANAVIYGGLFQIAEAGSGTALASFVNGGTFELGVQAAAQGDEIAIAFAQAYGGAQEVIAYGENGSAVASFVNSGDFIIQAFADASVDPTDANTAFTFANAAAQATGLRQYSNQGSVSFENSGTVDVRAFAESDGPSANGYAVAMGVIQQAGGTDGLVSFANDGEFLVAAGLEAVGDEGYGFVNAAGYRASGSALDVDVANGGTMTVAAFLEIPNGGTAAAVGFDIDAAVATTVTDVAAVLQGTLSNSGELNVLASAIGGTVATFTTGGGTTIVPGSQAIATGISLASGVNVMTVSNSGAINVDALTADGGNAEATGIRVVGNGTGSAPGADAVFTFTNDGGTIVVRESVDGGDTWRRGMAIDVSAAPNASVINLVGDGAIYGNIAVQDGDEIRVADGTTYFDGIINPQLVLAGGITEDVLDSGLAGVGSLIIGDGGNLVLADPRLTGDPDMYDGPAYALVDTLTVEADGTLTFELQPEEGGVQPVGSYPQVFADTANLDGTLAVEFTAPGGLIDDAYTYDNVIDANVRVGQFDQCVLGGTYEDSLLVGLECAYDNQANVDLTIERVAFNEPALNFNGASVGEGLECIYDVSLTGGIADMLADLFLFTDPVNYTIALNQLSGSVYANYLQSFPSLGVHYNDILAKATDCEVPALAGSVLECRASSGLHLWGQADYQWRKADGDEEAGTAKSKRGSFVVGLDANVGAAGIIGGSIGYVTNNVRDNQFGDDADASGLQVGLYGVYDPGTFYVKAMSTYSWYDGDSERNINFAGLAPGATFAASPDGDPDVTMWTAGIHAGARFAMGGNSVLTPYLNWDYVNAKLKSFQETGGNGADLTVYGGRARHSFLTGGVKWATQMGGVVPEVNLGYRYRFGDRRSDFSASFLGDAGCEFDIISAAQKRGTFLAGVSVGGKMGPVDLRIGYEGEFNSDVTSHAGNFKFVLPLGGKKTAAAAPAPVMAPPMPSAEPAPPAPVEAPPPPPPASSGERGL